MRLFHRTFHHHLCVSACNTAFGVGKDRRHRILSYVPFPTESSVEHTTTHVSAPHAINEDTHSKRFWSSAKRSCSPTHHPIAISICPSTAPPRKSSWIGFIFSIPASTSKREHMSNPSTLISHLRHFFPSKQVGPMPRDFACCGTCSKICGTIQVHTMRIAQI